MEPGQDPDDSNFVLDECHDLLEEIKRKVRDERYEDTTIHPPEY